MHARQTQAIIFRTNVEGNTRLNTHSFDDFHPTIWAAAVERLGDSLIFIGGVNNRNTATVPLATSTQVSMNIARGELAAACLTTVGTSRLDLYPAGVRQSISTNPADVCVICLAGRCGNVVDSICA